MACPHCDTAAKPERIGTKGGRTIYLCPTCAKTFVIYGKS